MFFFLRRGWMRRGFVLLFEPGYFLHETADRIFIGRTQGQFLSLGFGIGGGFQLFNGICKFRKLQ